MTDEEAKRHKCPKCKAAKGDPCTYLSSSPGAWTKPQFTREAGITVREVRYLKPGQVDRIGQPMKRIHIERRDRALKARHQPALPPVQEATTDQREAFRAIADWSHREYLDLREWIKEHHTLFNKPSAESDAREAR